MQKDRLDDHHRIRVVTDGTTVHLVLKFLHAGPGEEGIGEEEGRGGGGIGERRRREIGEEGRDEGLPQSRIVAIGMVVEEIFSGSVGRSS
ncbi:hypothetical protein QZH41_000028 [Actinostola sp. cb2023]|nr:hypothetical protein QZH41_000028 [Actinostola sp. cb2023]